MINQPRVSVRPQYSKAANKSIKFCSSSEIMDIKDFLYFSRFLQMDHDNFYLRYYYHYALKLVWSLVKHGKGKAIPVQAVVALRVVRG
jgi:hypothetical protein